MLTKKLPVILFLIFLFPKNLWAVTNHESHGDDHPQIFHAFTLEGDVGEARNGNTQSWDLNGWVGGDYNRIWLKSEGEVTKGKTEDSNIEVLYGRNISRFWDAQFGVRHDFKEKSTNYLEIGFEGLAPQSFETEIHAFLSEDGDLSLRLRQEVDIFLTQWLITQPYLELEAFSQDVLDKEVKSGISNAEIGLITRYEITRKFAPYFALRYHTKTFGTADYAKQIGVKVDNFIVSAGIRLRF